MNKTLIRKTHRWLGLIFSLSVLFSSGSGVLHNVMTRTQAPPPAARPTGEALDAGPIRIGLAEAIARIAPAKAQAVNVRQIAGQPWYQIYTSNPGAPVYVNAIDGETNDAMDATYASEIASAFLGGAAVREAGYLTAFNSEYISIFRVLPVYRFDLDDKQHTRVYVSTLTGSVTRHTDDRRQFEASVFTNVHKFGFIPNKDIRDLVLTTTTLGVFVASLLGVLLFFLTRPRTSRSNKPRSTASTS